MGLDDIKIIELSDEFCISDYTVLESFHTFQPTFEYNVYKVRRRKSIAFDFFNYSNFTLCVFMLCSKF